MRNSKYARRIQPKPNKGEKVRSNKTFSLLGAQLIYKIYHRQHEVLHIHSTPIHKSIHKNRFHSLVGSFNFIKSSFVSFLPNRPQRAQRNYSPFFLSFSTHKRVISTKQTPNWAMQSPLHSEKGVDQVS